MLCKGHFYKLFIVDAHGHDLSTLDIQAQFEWIVKDAEKQAGGRITFNFFASTKLRNWAKIGFIRKFRYPNNLFTTDHD